MTAQQSTTKLHTDYPPLPEPKYSRIVDGLPCITVYEHQNMMRAYIDADRAMRTQAAPAAVAEQGSVVHDEDLLEQMYWEFDDQRRRTGEERLTFKGKMRSYASEFRRSSNDALDAARNLFDAGWKACAKFCDRDDVIYDGIVGTTGCPEFEKAFEAVWAAQQDKS